MLISIEPSRFNVVVLCREILLSVLLKRRPQSFFCMWHGLTVRGVVRMLSYRPAFAWSYLPRWLSIAGMSVLNSLECAAESIVYGSRIRQTSVEHAPVFILGHWRSGTTLLHNLMALDSQLTFPNLYQCMCPGHFLLTEPIVAPLTAFCLPNTRPMDNMPMGWQVPMEDEMAIAVDCGISPYLMAAFQDRRELYERFLDPESMTDEQLRVWERSFLTLLKKLQIRSDKPVLLKSPTHTLRIPLLLKLFPGAKFVYLVRNPYAVLPSTLHLRNTMMVENSLEPPRGTTAREDTFLVYEQCIRTFEQTKSLIPAGQLHTLRFEELEADPLRHVEQVYQSLQLPGWDELRPAVEQQVQALAGYRKNRLTMDDEMKQEIRDRFGWIFERYGYAV